MQHGSVLKTKRTDVIKRDVSPRFNESFVFKVSADDLDKSSYVVTVWQSLSGQRGICMIMFAPNDVRSAFILFVIITKIIHPMLFIIV